MKGMRLASLRAKLCRRGEDGGVESLDILRLNAREGDPQVAILERDRADATLEEALAQVIGGDAHAFEAHKVA